MSLRDPKDANEAETGDRFHLYFATRLLALCGGEPNSTKDVAAVAVMWLMQPIPQNHVHVCNYAGSG